MAHNSRAAFPHVWDDNRNLQRTHENGEGHVSVGLGCATRLRFYMATKDPAPCDCGDDDCVGDQNGEAVVDVPWSEVAEVIQRLQELQRLGSAFSEANGKAGQAPPVVWS